ncbi:ras-related protein Rab-24 isoform X2 [Calliopsis andreniformis]|uniref:ras-related protein Rab-24 isoform X2 n=1 Tax=Calliopsis andreniformis TaxID=337506 RepID=UPI003FCE6725
MNRVDLKVVLVGNAAVGKTSLVERFVHERFNENLSYQNTIGAAYAAKQIQLDGKKLVMGIWDTAGCERYDAMVKIFYRGAKAAIVCYDITNSTTFQKVKAWVRELRSVEEGCKVYICATKSDILEHGAVPSPDINIVETYTAGIQAKFFITSSKTGENVDNLRNIEEEEKERITVFMSNNSKRPYCC